ncbi:hypothetical protein [Sphingomonas sp. 37zxx]|uniref:hypothetical protein n=1 Tax=Sphingomonas sp. 37zxx TaxID=1550073 RepID=UPI00053BDAF1|nr:hypothetical protein [Sphingomonas sp. 37zxx]
MKNILIPVLAAAFTLAGCGSEPAPAPASPPANAVAADGTDYQAAVAALPEAQRNGVFIRAIRDSGLPCQGVTSSERQGDTGSVWRARCDDGVDHIISIEADGNAKVSTRATANQPAK